MGEGSEKNVIGFDVLVEWGGVEGMGIDRVGCGECWVVGMMRGGGWRVMREEEVMKVVRRKMGR